ncbi:hypothetical protein [Streptomyces sp. NPDC000404]|uniref:hypothetical protein n=1 Tax=Streptomyces sp. NPDC000404 TaxID=3154253 RepID=UPI003326BFDF
MTMKITQVFIRPANVKATCVNFLSTRTPSTQAERVAFAPGARRSAACAEAPSIEKIEKQASAQSSDVYPFYTGQAYNRGICPGRTFWWKTLDVGAEGEN